MPALGGILFAVLSPLLPGSRELIVLDGRAVEAVLDARADRLGRELTPQEREETIRDHLDQEILVREAYRRELHMRDSGVRARLLRRMRLAVSEGIPEPSRSQLRAYYSTNSARYQQPESITLAHVFWASGSEDLPSRPEAPLEELRAGGPRDGGAATRLASVAPVVLVAAYLLYPFARISAEIPLISEPRLQREQAQGALEGLLVNVYRSFDIHDEQAIYDRLSLAVTGEQLLDVYLESRRALELENRGGAGVRIDEVAVREIRDVSRTEDGGFEVDALWTVGGSVSHFGHQHFRLNRYDALVEIVPDAGTWKIRAITLLEERRLM